MLGFGRHITYFPNFLSLNFELIDFSKPLEFKIKNLSICGTAGFVDLSTVGSGPVSLIICMCALGALDALGRDMLDMTRGAAGLVMLNASLKLLVLLCFGGVSTGKLGYVACLEIQNKLIHRQEMLSIYISYLSNGHDVLKRMPVKVILSIFCCYILTAV